MRNYILMLISPSLRLGRLRIKDQESDVTDGAPSDVEQELVYYNDSGTKYLYIFNHKEYQKTKYFGNKTPSARNGTECDVNRLSSIFETLGYEVSASDDLTYNEIMDAVLNISYADHRGTSRLVFAVLTHGDRGGEVYAADRPYQLQDLSSALAHGHASLVGVPKIFFVQACRGKIHDAGRRLELDGEAAVTISSYADFLMLYSSVEDYVSYRNINGSFLIQELCNVIEKYHKRLDILHMTTLVQKRVTYEWVTYAPKDKKIHDKKQMPETKHTLTKLFMF